MKRLILCLMFMMFLITSVNAFEFDNVRDYDVATKTVTIKNAFGMGADIATIKLNTPQNYLVGAGYGKVAEFELNTFTDYDTAFKELEFYNKNGMVKFQRSFDYKYRTIEQVPTYQTVCNQFKAGNGSFVDNCSQVQFGLKDKEVWIDLGSVNFKEDDNLIIGIFTEVKVGDYVEWIPNFFGERITEWAVWTTSLSVGLQSYYKMDEAAANESAVIDAVGHQNATNIGAANTSGIINSAYNFSLDYITIADNASLENADDWSASFWMNADTLVASPVSLIDKGDAVSAFNFRWQDVTTLFLCIDNICAGDTSFTATDNWTHIVGTYDGADVRLYVDGASRANTSDATGMVANANNISIGSHFNGATNFFDGGIDEVGFWNRTLSVEEIVQIYNGGVGISFIKGIIIALNSPVDNANFSATNVTFNVTATDLFAVQNVTLFIDGVLNETNSSGVSGNYIFETTIPEGVHTWSVGGTNSGGETSNSSTRTFTILIDRPVINVTTPSGVIDFAKVGDTQSVEWNITSAGADACFIEYNGSNSSVGCDTNISSITLVARGTNLTFYANDSVGNQSASLINWNYHVFENNQTFNTNTTEGSTESFVLNYLANETPTSASFIYNESITAADIDTSNFPIVEVSESIVIPNIGNFEIVPFKWNIVTVSSNVNTTVTNQSIANLSLDNCSTFGNVLFNLTVIDEATQNMLNGSGDNVSVEVDVVIFTEDQTSQVLNFSTAFNQTNSNSICSANTLFNGTVFILDATFKYSSSGRAIEYYNIRDFTINNATTVQNITLFDILTSESTEFQITFKNSDFVVVDNALIQVNRQYVSEGLFKTVELPITDSNGQTVVHLVANDIVYNYIVTKNNIILGTFNNLIAFCDDASIGQCFISLNALSGTVPAFNPDTGSGISFVPLAFDETTRDLTFTFSTNDGSVRTIVMNGTKMDQLGNTSVCSTTVTSSSSTLTCNIAESLGNETIIIDVFVDDKLALTSFFSAANDIDLGFPGYFLLLFLIVSLALMFTESKSMTVFGVVLGFIAGNLLFFIEGGILATGSAIMWLIIMGIILIWKLNSEGQT